MQRKGLMTSFTAKLVFYMLSGCYHVHYMAVDQKIRSTLGVEQKVNLIAAMWYIKGGGCIWTLLNTFVCR